MNKVCKSKTLWLFAIESFILNIGFIFTYLGFSQVMYYMAMILIIPFVVALIVCVVLDIIKFVKYCNNKEM